MTIHYNLTGPARKELKTAVSQLLGVSGKYKGAPTFAYQVGEYLIDMIGTLTGPDDNALVADLQCLHGMMPTCEEYDDMPTDPDDYDGESAPDGATATTLTTTKDGELDTLTIEYPLDGFTPEKIELLCKLVTAKETLLKAALGADDLPIQLTENALCFPWFHGELSSDKVNAYTQLIAALCKMALAKTRITAKDKVVVNEKYAFRCFLLSLGMIGDEYKKSRKELLSKLKGNSSWKNGAPTIDETAPKGDIAPPENKAV